MYETILQQTTGIKLYQEEEQLMDAKKCELLCDMIDLKKTYTHVSEIFFDSPMIEEMTSPEQFMITIEKKGNNQTFTLKRKIKIGKYGSESMVRLSKKQYVAIMKGSIEWMKDSAKVLVNEFYQKIKLFEYKVGKIINCIRQEMYLTKKQMQIIIDTHIQELFANDVLPIEDSHLELAHVLVRCNSIS
ncbi:MAG: hypothetical protein RRX92_08965 [Lachnospiraceae bacterium]